MGKEKINNKNMKTYLEITAKKDGEVVKRMDVTGKGERAIERLINGISINLNHKEYFVREHDIETELPIV